MSIFLTMLLWILIIFFVLLLLFLFLPIGIGIKLDYDKLTVYLKILFFKIQIYPMKGKKKKAEKPTQTDNEKSMKEDNNQKKSKPKLDLDKIMALIKASGKAMKIIFKSLFFTKIEIVYPIHDEDSAQTAILYGKFQAYLSGAIAFLRNFLHLSFKKINIIPDFTGEYKYRRYFYCNIWGTAFIMIVAGIYVFKTLLREKIL